MSDSKPSPILLFADSVLGLHLYDWQCKILLNYEAGHQTAAACANFIGKTSTVFPVAALLDALQLCAKPRHVSVRDLRAKSLASLKFACKGYITRKGYSDGYNYHKM